MGGIQTSVCYRGDQDFQSFLFGADIVGSIEHGPCRAAAVQLWGSKHKFNDGVTGLVAVTTNAAFSQLSYPFFMQVNLSFCLWR